MQVGVLTTSFPLPQTPSSGVFVQKLVDHLAKHTQVVVLTPASRIPFVNDASQTVVVHFFRYAPWRFQLLAHQPGGIPVALRNHRWLWLLVPIFMGSMLLACIRHFRKADIVHANWAACGAIGGIAGQILGIPVVTTLRGSDVVRLQESAIDRALLKICLLTNRRIACVSDAIRSSVGERFPLAQDKLATIPNGVAEDFFSIQRDYQAADQLFRFCTTGNLIPLKSIHTAIYAFAKANIDESELNIIGAGSERPHLEHLASSLNLRSSVHFTGALPPEEIPEQLRIADAFVFTSTSEGRPNAVLEAMAAGLPIVASRIDGVTELITDGENGLLFEPGDAQALADCLQRLASDAGLRRKLGCAARQYLIDRKLTWDSTAARYLQVYEACVGEQA